MKKFCTELMTIILTLVCALALVSCNSNDSGDSKGTKDSKSGPPSKADYLEKDESLMYYGGDDTILVFDDASKTGGMIFQFDDRTVLCSHFSVSDNEEKDDELDAAYEGLAFSRILFDDEVFESHYWFACADEYAVFDYTSGHSHDYTSARFFKADAEDLTIIKTWFKALKDGKITEDTSDDESGTDILVRLSEYQYA